MRKNTDASPRQSIRRKDAWISAAGSTLLRLALAILLLLLRRYHQMEGLGGSLMLIIALLDLGSIIPIWILLRERLHEIEGGEEDAAAQY